MFYHAESVSCSNPQGCLLRDSRVLLEGPRTSHLERPESRVQRTDASTPCLPFALAIIDRTCLVCWLLGELPRGLI